MSSKPYQDEALVFFRRSANHLRFVRCRSLHPSKRASGYCVPNCETLGWTLNQYGEIVRAFYVYLSEQDGVPDGMGEVAITDAEKIGDPNVVLRTPLRLPREDYTFSDVLLSDERAARQPFADYWAEFYAKKAAEKAARERDVLSINTSFRPRPKPKGFLERLFG